jgi:hypothetical protein
VKEFPRITDPGYSQAEWIDKFLAAQVDKMRRSFVATDAHDELPDQCKLDRHMEAIARCAAACDACSRPWPDIIRYVAINEFALPAEEVEKAITRGREQAQAAREWRESGAKPDKVVLLRQKPDTPQSTIDALIGWQLRFGLGVLKEPGARDGLRRCDASAMRFIVNALLSWEEKSKTMPWLPVWPREDVAKLVRAWRALRRWRK